MQAEMRAFSSLDRPGLTEKLKVKYLTIKNVRQTIIVLFNRELFCAKLFYCVTEKNNDIFYTPNDRKIFVPPEIFLVLFVPIFVPNFVA